MSAIHRVSIAGDEAKAEARSLSGKMNATFRVKEDNTIFKMDDILQQIQDFYQRILNEVKRGERKPIKLNSWKSVEKATELFVLDRIPHNFAQFKKHSVKDAKVALIPCSFTAPHPTIAEKEAYMARWNDDGDLYKTMMAECRKHTNDKVVLSPQVIHTADPKSPVMVCLALIAY
nr:MAG: hypothetical protein [Lake Baikal virophage 12]